jgi:hypothetical protein
MKGENHWPIVLAVGVASVSNAKIVSTSECRTIVGVAGDQVQSVLRHVLLSLIEGEQEGLPLRIAYVVVTALFR